MIPLTIILLVRKADIRLTKSNKEFLSLELGDTSGKSAASYGIMLILFSLQLNPVI